ncbi:MAG TPA: 30S ribosomal protein S17 [Candidatus Paceibacterota bacterium]|nr:30S ribosomal protein S17 [Candidatus Paceibacterota bacterium]
MRRIKGKIVSDKMDKTRIVEVDRLKKHKRYLKYFNVTKRYKAHDENNEYKKGDEVVIEETKPISKEKRWRIVGLVKEASKK